MARDRSFHELEDVHYSLQQVFRRHQEALAAGDGDTATALFQSYARGLRAHIRVEETLLFPVYEERGHPGLGGGIDLLRSEHEKVETFLHVMGKRLAGLQPGAVIPPLERVEWIEEELGFKHLLDHHHRREQVAFFPGLDRAVPEEKRAGLLARCTALQAAEEIPAAG